MGLETNSHHVESWFGQFGKDRLKLFKIDGESKNGFLLSQLDCKKVGDCFSPFFHTNFCIFTAQALVSASLFLFQTNN